MILYPETISDAVRGVAFGRDRIHAAAAAIGLGSSISQSGSGVMQDYGGTHHVNSDNLWGGEGGHGAGRTQIWFSLAELVVPTVIWESSSASGLKLYSSWAAGGQVGWRYHALLNNAW